MLFSPLLNDIPIALILVVLLVLQCTSNLVAFLRNTATYTHTIQCRVYVHLWISRWL